MEGPSRAGNNRVPDGGGEFGGARILSEVSSGDKGGCGGSLAFQLVGVASGVISQVLKR
jgi:hypothetical protein